MEYVMPKWAEETQDDISSDENIALMQNLLLMHFGLVVPPSVARFFYEEWLIDYHCGRP